MMIAKGSFTWVISAFIAGMIFLILTLFSNSTIARNIFLFLTIVLFLKTSFLILFFRDPERDIGKGIVACADGKIREIKKTEDEKVGEVTIISTFMNLHNVHVNRMPYDGIIKNVVHKKGSHIPAFNKESEKNERLITFIDTEIGKIKVVQIAGTIARRIVPYIKKEDKLKKGERIGIIRFGSRVDVYLPSRKIKIISVRTGDIIKAGETTIAEING